MPHECTDYRKSARQSEWYPIHEWELRDHYRIDICADPECGLERPRRTAPPVYMRERRAATPTEVRLAGPITHLLADKLLKQGRMDVPWKGLENSFLRQNHGLDELHTALDDLIRGGLVSIRERPRGPSWEPATVIIVDANRVESTIFPGRQEQKLALQQELLNALALHEGSVAERARAIIEGPRAGWSVEALRSLAAVALHAVTGKEIAVRALSAVTFRDTKLLERHLPRIIKTLGKMEELNLVHHNGMTHSGLTLVGGSGLLLFPGGEVDLSVVSPFIGLPRDRVLSLAAVESGKDGIVFLENLTVFELACSGQIPGFRESTIVFTKGKFGRATAHVADLAGGAQVLAWFDMDAEGIEEFRRLHQLTGGRATPLHMSVEAFHDAPVRKPIKEPGKIAAIKRALEHGGPLQDVLLEISRTREFVEQESQIATLIAHEVGVHNSR